MSQMMEMHLVFNFCVDQFLIKTVFSAPAVQHL